MGLSEYAGYITADCDGMAQSYYENTAVEINAANIILGGYDNDEKAQEILVKKDTDTTEKFYVANSDLIYVYLDGCKFYFQRALNSFLDANLVVDGAIGSETIKSINAIPDSQVDKFMDVLKSERLNYLEGTENWETSKNGWTKRTNKY